MSRAEPGVMAPPAKSGLVTSVGIDRDPVTGLVTRVEAERSFHDDVERARGDNLALAVVSLGVERLWATVDEYGAEAGADALRTIALATTYTLRAGDLAARIAPAEFLITLQGASKLCAERAIGRVLRVACQMLAADPRWGSLELTYGTASLQEDFPAAVTNVSDALIELASTNRTLRRAARPRPQSQA